MAQQDSEYRPCKNPWGKTPLERRIAEMERPERRLDYQRDYRQRVRDEELKARTLALKGSHLRIRPLTSPDVSELGIVAVYGPKGTVPYLLSLHGDMMDGEAESQ